VWDIVCIPVACSCVSSVDAHMRGCVGLLYHEFCKWKQTLSYTQYDAQVQQF
jgi:hypothetical protein